MTHQSELKVTKHGAKLKEKLDLCLLKLTEIPIYGIFRIIVNEIVQVF